jgi:acetyltransferase-like isoleucine patch superfamily enzyme
MIQIINNFASFMPSVNISGNVVIHEKYTWVQVLKLSMVEIGQSTIVGAGAVVSKSA